MNLEQFKQQITLLKKFQASLDRLEQKSEREKIRQALKDESLKKYLSFSKDEIAKAGFTQSTLDSLKLYHANALAFLDDLDQIENGDLTASGKDTLESLKERKSTGLKSAISHLETRLAEISDSAQKSGLSDRPATRPENLPELKPSANASNEASLVKVAREAREILSARSGENALAALDRGFGKLEKAELAKLITTESGKLILNSKIAASMRKKGLVRKELSELESRKEIEGFSLAETLRKDFTRTVANYSVGSGTIDSVYDLLKKFSDVNERFSASADEYLRQNDLVNKKSPEKSESPDTAVSKSEIDKGSASPTEHGAEASPSSPEVNFRSMSGNVTDTMKTEMSPLPSPDVPSFKAAETLSDINSRIEEFKKRIKDAAKNNPAAIVAAPPREYFALLKETMALVDKVPGHGMYGTSVEPEDLVAVNANLAKLDAMSKDIALYLSQHPGFAPAEIKKETKVTSPDTSVVDKAPVVDAIPAAAAAPSSSPSQIEQQQRKAETLDEMNARIKGSALRKDFLEHIQGTKDLDAERDQSSGEHPLKKRGVLIEAIDAHYQTGIATRWGARARSMFGMQASRLPVEIQQQKDAADTATNKYISQLEGDYLKRLKARVDGGKMTAERSEQLMSKFRVMLGNRFAIKYEERMLQAEQAALPENQKNALMSVMRAYARAPKSVKIGIAATAITGMAALSGGLGAMATAAVGGKIAYRSIMIGTGLGALVGSSTMKIATRVGQNKFLRAKENAQASASALNIDDLRRDIRAGAYSIQRGKVAGFGAAAVVGGLGGALAGDVGGWNDAVTTTEGTTDVPPVTTTDTVPTPSQNEDALNALKSQLESLRKDSVTVSEIVKGADEPLTDGPRIDRIPPTNETEIAKIIDRVGSDTHNETVIYKNDSGLEKIQGRLVEETGGETVIIKNDSGVEKEITDRIESDEQAEDSRLDKEEAEKDETESDSVEDVDIHTVAKGEHIWGISETHFPELLDQLHDGHERDVALMQLRDVLSANNGEILKEVGGSSNHADLINPGDRIELSKLEGHLQRIVLKMTELQAPELPQDLTLGRTEVFSAEGMKVSASAIEEPPVPSSHLEYTPPKMVQVAEVSTNEIPKPLGTLNDAVKDAQPVAPAVETLNSDAKDTASENYNRVIDAALGATGAVVGTAVLNPVSGESASRVTGRPLGQEFKNVFVSDKDLSQMRKRILDTIDNRGLFGRFTRGSKFFNTFKQITLGDFETNYLAKRRGDPVARRALVSAINSSGIDLDTFESWMNNLERWKNVVPFEKTSTLGQYVDSVAKYLIQTGQKV